MSSLGNSRAALIEGRTAMARPIDFGKDGVIFINCLRWLGKLLWRLKNRG